MKSWMRWGSSWAALMVAALTLPAMGQDLGDVRPGDPRLAVSELSPFVAVYDVSLSEGDSVRSLGYWKWHLQEASVAGTTAWRLVWSLFFPQATVYDQIIFLDDTFAPVMRNVLSFQGNDIIDFTGPDIRYTRVPLRASTDSMPSTQTLIMDGARFAGGALLALPALDLAEGQTFRFPVFATDPGPTIGQNIWSDYVVHGRETLTAGGRDYDTWVVEQGPWMLWVSKESPYIIKRTAANRTWLLRSVQNTE